VKKNLVLVGMMASGKTTLGKIVAKKQNLKFIDTDLNIEKRNSMTINEIFEKKGEEFFRVEEEKETLKCLKKNNCVISLGGGAFMNKNIRESVLKNCVSIWLDVDAKTINKRIKWNNKRPLLNKEDGLSKINDLYVERKDNYKKANYKIVCKNLKKDDLVKKILNLYEKQ
tara:strand:- start:195 stop:704 length:510 start_codon:yes stop_codon:yes gene_type:complete